VQYLKRYEMMGRLRSLAEAVFKRSQFEQEMDAEMHEHLHEYVEALIRKGVSAKRRHGERD
jgi:hypothetical protein